MPYKSLPANPSLQHLKCQARDLKKALSEHEAQAAQRVREFHPRFVGASDSAILESKFTLTDAQMTIAREHRYPSWSKLKAAIVSSSSAPPAVPHHERISDPIFRRAVDLLDAGDEAGLREQLRSHPGLARQHVFFDIGAYFGNPTLLEFCAENPIRRGALPSNIVEMARIILEAGAKQDSDSKNQTLGLVSSGRVPRECEAQVPLIDLLCDYGADPEQAMEAALGHGEFEAVEALIRRGAKTSLAVASATGRTEIVRDLLSRASAEERHRSLALAAQFGRLDVVRLLIDAGEDPSRFNPMGTHSHSTPLHQAALAGHFDVVKLLVERGADVRTKDIVYHGASAGWAEHGGHPEIAEFLRNRAEAGGDHASLPGTIFGSSPYGKHKVKQEGSSPKRQAPRAKFGHAKRAQDVCQEDEASGNCGRCSGD